MPADTQIRTLLISSINGSAPSRPDEELAIGLHREGIAVTVMIPRNSPRIRRFEELGIRVIAAHPQKKISIRSIRLLRKEIRREQYHILHLFNTRAIVNGSLAALGIPVKVLAYRGAAGMYWYDPTAWLSHLNRRIDYLICNSHYVQQHMRRQLLFRPRKAVMIHKGMDREWFSNVSPVSRKTLGIPENAILAGCVANVRRIKGVPYLLEATRYIRHDLPVHLLLIGNGMDHEQFRRLIASSPMRDRIHVLGYRPDVYNVISACDLYIQPSLSESLSRSVMEAMCLGVPCIVSAVGGLAELVVHQQSGLLVEKANPPALAEAVNALAGDAGLRKTYAEEGIRRMQQIFSVNNMVANTLKLYRQVVR